MAVQISIDQKAWLGVKNTLCPRTSWYVFPIETRHCSLEVEALVTIAHTGLIRCWPPKFAMPRVPVVQIHVTFMWPCTNRYVARAQYSATARWRSDFTVGLVDKKSQRLYTTSTRSCTTNLRQIRGAQTDTKMIVYHHLYIKTAREIKAQMLSRPWPLLRK